MHTNTNHDLYNEDKVPNFKRERAISIPSYLLPKRLRDLHEQIAEKRAEIRTLEYEFRTQLSELLSTLPSD